MELPVNIPIEILVIPDAWLYATLIMTESDQIHSLPLLTSNNYKLVINKNNEKVYWNWIY